MFEYCQVFMGYDDEIGEYINIAKDSFGKTISSDKNLMALFRRLGKDNWELVLSIEQKMRYDNTRPIYFFKRIAK